MLGQSESKKKFWINMYGSKFYFGNNLYSMKRRCVRFSKPGLCLCEPSVGSTSTSWFKVQTNILRLTFLHDTGGLAQPLK